MTVRIVTDSTSDIRRHQHAGPRLTGRRKTPEPGSPAAAAAGGWRQI